MKKVLNILLISLSILIISCGKTTQITGIPVNNEQTRINGLITSVSISNNILNLNTNDSTYYKFEYYNVYNSSNKYYGYSTINQKKLIHQTHLPVQFSNSNYRIRVTALSKKGYQDTTFYFQSAPNTYPFLKVTAIDVAQGDAILIETPAGNNVQIDGGYGSRSNPSELWAGGGVPLALNYLKNNGIDHLKYIIETHPHADHNGGLRDIQADSDITVDNYFNYNSIDSVGTFLFLDNQVQFQVLNKGYPSGYPTDSANNMSVVMRLVYGESEYIFTGDAEGYVQTFMMGNPYPLSSDFLKISHHGASSNGTSSMLFLNTVLNQFNKIGILSFGTNNPYDHPRDLTRFTKFNIFGTETPSDYYNYPNFYFDQGNIITYSDGQSIVVTNKKNN